MELEISRPDDWHLHLRDEAALKSVLPHSVRQFARALVMPNLNPPVTTVDDARAYHQRIVAALPEESNFEPLMSLYLTRDIQPDTIQNAKRAGIIAFKLYPAGATTHSAAGVTNPGALDPVFDAMQETDMVLCVHGEVTDSNVDVFDREAEFIERHLSGIVERFPQLRVILEHVTTRQGVDFVRGARAGVAATITAHHLLFNRNALLAGKLRPHYYCAPVLKAEQHREAVVQAATSGEPRFFLGTDSAPHARTDKESACGCAGIFTAHAALELYAKAFEQVDALDRLEAFAGHFGADFYGLPRNEGKITLRKESWRVDETLPFAQGELVPLLAGETLGWRLADDVNQGNR